MEWRSSVGTSLWCYRKVMNCMYCHRSLLNIVLMICPLRLRINIVTVTKVMVPRLVVNPETVEACFNEQIKGVVPNVKWIAELSVRVGIVAGNVEHHFLTFSQVVYGIWVNIFLLLRFH